MGGKRVMEAKAPPGDDLSAPGTVAENEPPPPTEYGGGIDGGMFIGGLAGLGFDFDGNGEKACFPCFCTLTCYRACISGVLQGLAEKNIQGATDTAAGVLAGMIICPCAVACSSICLPCDIMAGFIWLGSAGCCCKCFECPMKMITPSREGTITQEGEGGQIIRFHELPLRSCVQCAHVLCCVWVKDGEFFSLCCNWQGFREPHCNWCCGCSGEEIFEESDYQQALDAHNKQVDALEAKINQLPEATDRINITITDGNGRSISVAAHPAAPISRLMETLGMDESSEVQFAGQPMLRAARLEPQAIVEGAILNVEDLAESMLAEALDVPGDLEAALRLELKTEQTNAPEQIAYRYLKEDFTFCCVPLAPSTYIPLASVQAPLEPRGSLDHLQIPQPASPEGSLAATDSVEAPTTTTGAVMSSQQL